MTSVHDDPKYQPGDPPGPADLDSEIIISPDTLKDNRIPPGQTRTRKWPVLHASVVPTVNRDTWQLEIKGLVANPLTLTWEEFQELPRTKVFSDFHCVTTWSRLGNIWEGVATRELIARVNVQPQAKFVIATGYDDGWTTNLPLEDFAEEDALLADLHDGEPISADHGGPVRLMVPRLYAWKSAKWIKAIEFVSDDQPGYWERGGYHNHGDPWTEERFG